jgi:hypothetical protein
MINKMTANVNNFQASFAGSAAISDNMHCMMMTTMEEMKPAVQIFSTHITCHEVVSIMSFIYAFS